MALLNVPTPVRRRGPSSNMKLEVSTKIKRLQNLIQALGCEPSGPTYQDNNKHLAEVLLSSGNEKEAVYHLCESHGTTLRNEALAVFNRGLRRAISARKSQLENLKEKLSFEGKWHKGIDGLYNRLSELPSEWTVVQLTLEWDPSARFLPRNRDVNLGFHIARLPCGKPSVAEEKPVVISLPAFSKEEMSIMTAVKQGLAKMDDKVKVNRKQTHDECSLRIEAAVRDLEMWLGGWHSLLFGKLVDENLTRAIKSAVDASIASYGTGKEATTDEEELKSPIREQDNTKQFLSEKALYILYLVASSPSVSMKHVLEVCRTLVEDEKFALYLSKQISGVVRSYSAALQLCRRHPVVLVIDEALDILPFEVMSAVQEQSFTRMPSIHFLHALHSLHKNFAAKNGINTRNGFYVVNPTNNLPQLSTLFKNLSTNSVVQNWKGILEVCPSKEEFLAGLQEHDLFLYCGHGGGNQFIPTDYIEQSEIRAVAFLFGCSSSRLLDQGGGRVEMTSVSNSYLIAGSPCVVGMLWQVLDTDINTMTNEIIKLWCCSGMADGKVIDKVGGLEEKFSNLNLGSGKEPVLDLGDAVCLVRKHATKFLNKAAVIVRGLPVSAMCQ